MRRPTLLLVALLAGCGPKLPPASRPPTEVTASSAPAAAAAPSAHCELAGRLGYATIRTRDGGAPYGWVNGASARLALERHDDAVVLDGDVTVDGWHLRARLDPTEDAVVRVRRALWLTDGVGLAAGAPIRLRDARAGEAEATVQIDERRRGLRFVAPPARWLPCDAIGFPVLEDTPPELERRALELPAEPPSIALRPTAPIPLAVAPGAAPFAELLPTERARTHRLLESRDGHRRVLVHLWDGVLIAGWADEAAIEAATTEPAGGTGALLGASAGGEPFEQCTSESRVTVHAVIDGDRHEIGWLDPRTPFIRRAEGDGRSFPIAPRRGDPLGAARDVEWWGESRTLLSCETVTPERGDLASVLASAGASLSIEAEVSQSNLSSVPAGTRCDVELSYAALRRYPCRATVRCGGVTVYGERPTNGFFECEADLDASPPAVRGRDAQPSSASGDPALSLDADALEITDNAAGSHGAFRLRARVTSVRRD